MNCSAFELLEKDEGGEFTEKAFAAAAAENRAEVLAAEMEAQRARTKT